MPHETLTLKSWESIELEIWGKTIEIQTEKEIPDISSTPSDHTIKALSSFFAKIEKIMPELRGEKGDQGEKWEKGEDGKDWRDGIDWKDGLSAYEIAVNLGFQWSENEYIESLKGKDGKDWRDGKDWIDGKDGRDGKDWKDGRDGRPGEPWPRGIGGMWPAWPWVAKWGTTWQILAKKSGTDYDTEWINPGGWGWGGGTGDMTKAVYDTNDNGIVDNSERLEGQVWSFYLDRANHTGTQAISTVTWLGTALDSKMDESVYDTDLDGVVDASETVRIIVRNSTGATLTKWQVVYLQWATGNRPNALLADASTEATSSKTIWIVIANIANNSDGYVATSGTLHDLDLSAFADGDRLWLSETAWAMVANTPPAEPAHSVFIGTVARAHPTLGRIVLAIQNGYELGELHGVDTTGEADNDLLQRKAWLWVPRTPAQVKTDLALTKWDVWLWNVDNTSDLNKPISTATQTALNGKANTSHTHVSTDVTDFDSATRAQVEAELVAWSNITITPSWSGATRQLIISATPSWWSIAFTEVEINIGNTPRYSWKFNIIGTGFPVWRNVMIQQSVWPYTGKWTRADEAECDSLVVRWRVTSSTNIECYWTSATKVWKNFKFIYAISA